MGLNSFSRRQAARTSELSFLMRAVRQVRTGYVDAPPDVREGQMFPDKPSGSLNELYSGSGGVSLHFGGLSLALSVVTLIVLLPFVGL